MGQKEIAIRPWRQTPEVHTRFGDSRRATQELLPTTSKIVKMTDCAGPSVKHVDGYWVGWEEEKTLKANLHV